MKFFGTARLNFPCKIVIPRFSLSKIFRSQSFLYTKRYPYVFRLCETKNWSCLSTYQRFSKAQTFEILFPREHDLFWRHQKPNFSWYPCTFLKTSFYNEKKTNIDCFRNALFNITMILSETPKFFDTMRQKLWHPSILYSNFRVRSMGRACRLWDVFVLFLRKTTDSFERTTFQQLHFSLICTMYQMLVIIPLCI